MFQQLMENLTRRQKIYLIGSFGAFIGLFVLVGLITSFTSKPKPGDVIRTVDKNSGDKSTTVVGQTENFGDQNNGLLVYGLSGLIDLGMTTGQTSALQNSIAQYAKINGLSIKKASITTKDIKVTAINFQSADQTTIITAPLLIDDKQTLNMKISYKTRNDFEVTLSTSDNKLLYASGRITL